MPGPPRPPTAGRAGCGGQRAWVLALWVGAAVGFVSSPRAPAALLGRGGIGYRAVRGFSARSQEVELIQVTGWERPGLGLHYFQTHHFPFLGLPASPVSARGRERPGTGAGPALGFRGRWSVPHGLPQAQLLTPDDLYGTQCFPTHFLSWLPSQARVASLWVFVREGARWLPLW